MPLAKRLALSRRCRRNCCCWRHFTVHAWGNLDLPQVGYMLLWCLLAFKCVHYDVNCLSIKMDIQYICIYIHIHSIKLV
jgi:hypothetical protein